MSRSSIVLNPFLSLARLCELLLSFTQRKDVTWSEVRKIKKGDPTKYPPFADKLSSVYIFFLSFSLAPLRIKAR